MWRGVRLVASYVDEVLRLRFSDPRGVIPCLSLFVYPSSSCRAVGRGGSAARICVRGVAVFIRLGGGGVAVLMMSLGRRRGSIGVIHMAARGEYAMSDGCGERSTIYE